MNKPIHVNPGRGEILPCADDAACEITSRKMCMKEVPLTATLNEEGADYLHHFCGLDCLEIWRRRAQREFPTDAVLSSPNTQGEKGI